MAEIPRIDTVSITGTVLHVGWRGGCIEDIDIAGWLARPGPPEFEILKAPEVLTNPKVAGWGSVVAWDDEGDVGIDSYHLRLLADQQKPFQGNEISGLQRRMGLLDQEAAKLLNVDVAALRSYRDGTAPVPQVVQIACRAIERDPVLFEAHYKPPPKAA